MPVLYLDCFSGISGDMLLGALMDLGLSYNSFVQQLAGLAVSFELSVQKVTKGHIQATQVKVIDREIHHSQSIHHPHRCALDMISLVERSTLSPTVREKTSQALWAIARVEGKIHGQPPEAVHLHELSGIDTVVDLAGAFLGIEMLGVTEVYSSPVPTGRGWIDSSHGPLPVPAPATLELLSGLPFYPGDLEGELTTPTGAAFLSTLPCRFETLPPLMIEHIGYGAGTKDFFRPNVLRALLGHWQHQAASEENVMIETNFDDMSPQIIEYLSEKLFEEGAYDVFLTPVIMKKFRAGFKLSVLTSLEHVETLQALIFQETSTLGVRWYRVNKVSLPRRETTVETKWGPVRIKVAKRPSGKRITPEYEDCKRIARKFRVPLVEVYQQVEQQVEQPGGEP